MSHIAILWAHNPNPLSFYIIPKANLSAEELATIKQANLKFTQSVAKASKEDNAINKINKNCDYAGKWVKYKITNQFHIANAHNIHIDSLCITGD